MNSQKIIKETKQILISTLTIGLIMLLTGIIFNILDVNIIKNNKAVIGLSFIPLSLSLLYYIKLIRIIKNPRKMKKTIINETDERIIVSKNKADAKAFRILQSILFLFYTGYTLIIPEDIFESVGWWILLALLIISFGIQSILYYIEIKNSNSSK
ncbi:MAG: hypothetical protein PHS24_00565 [Bacilli bacterium]|nr:hypothetical protein [Bacilli bacterium]